MGKKNDELAWYLNRPSVLADFFNGSLYEGRQAILSEELAEMQKTYEESLQSRYGKKRKVRRERDVGKLLCRRGHFVLLAVENQDKPNLCMPLRNAEYDVTEYVRQLRRIKRRNEAKKDWADGVEYLSGVKRTDRLIPAITVVLYHGQASWNAPGRLQELLDTDGMDEVLHSLLMDYRLHIINLTELKEENFKTGLRELIGMMKRRDSKEALQAYCRENEDRFRNMDDETYDLICTMINHKTLAKKKERCRNKERRGVDMCKAIDEMVLDGKREGKEEGKRQGILIGEKRGEKAGEEKLSRLIAQLLSENRLADISKVTGSVQARRRLYREYGI